MSAPNITEAHQQLEGKWRGILEGAGLDAKTLRKVAGPCPLCGGVDRFRFDDKGLGRYYCQGCGPGDGFKLLMGWLHMTFPEAKAYALDKAGVIEKDRPQKERSDADKLADLRKIWAAGTPYAEGLVAYMLSRGLDADYAADPNLRWHPSLRWSVDGQHGANPAMLARFYQWGKDGKIQSVTVHRTWPTGCPKKKMVMPSPVTMNGIFCPIGGMPKDGKLIVAEGIESALSLRQVLADADLDMPSWATYSAEEMKKFNPPDDVKQLYIAVDMDYSFTGQAAAYELARRMRQTKPGIEVISVMRPCIEDGTKNWDWNDELKSRNP